ncbi:hypothetical protein ASG43_21775 [Aureimonas sp. Leaf454]|uniref:ParB/RepB/Spo0J family partition protein n=1 Tax=Aureimonas sp. Leaf454 TaxID=1736381 RepID=UPI0006FD251E|nr:ParB/RepB/Spo0J family partition protein [Aureimonas sp. Leaf454]KQT50187.1 hypothetical protein ASG43_21775 [Aureimonas sp. Leaf454]
MSIKRDKSFTAAMWTLNEKQRKSKDAEVFPRPETLPLSQLRTCPEVFQPRVGGARDGAQNEDHVKELVQQLSNKPADSRFLDPITVYAIGRAAYVVNGHHRLAAYKRAGITAEVPVTFFEGTFEEAAQESIRANSKINLNMDKEDRNEGAWRLVVMDRTGKGKSTKAAIAEATGVSPRSVARMRSLYDGLQAKLGRQCEFSGVRHEVDLGSYRDALRADRGGGGEWDDETGDAMVEQMRQALGKTFGKQAHKHTDQFAEALELFLGPQAMTRVAEHLGLSRSEDWEEDDETD